MSNANKTLLFEAISAADAQKLWADSPVATAFTNPEVLARIVDKVEWWGVYRSEQLIIAWPVCTNRDVVGVRPDLSYYVGPIIDAEIFTFKLHRYWSIYAECLAFAVRSLVDRYRNLRFALHYATQDLRPLLWAFQEMKLDHCLRIVPRYSAILALAEVPDERELFQNLARNRKREIKRHVGSDLLEDLNCSPKEVFRLYETALERQGEQPTDDRMEALSKLFGCIQSTRGCIRGWRNPESGRLASVIALLYGRDDANNVLCVADRDRRDQGLTAWTTWQGIRKAMADGMSVFDFNGANSPLRAADKHYYGAQPVLYFAVEWAVS